MKKMFFTAIALVAFSATSMANTIEVKEVVIKRTPECTLAATYVYEFYMDYYFGGGDDAQFLNELTSAMCD